MVQFVTGYPSRSSAIGEILGQSLGEGLGNFVGMYQANKSLQKVLNDPSLKNAPLEQKHTALQKALSPHGKRGERLLAQTLEMEDRQIREKEKTEALRIKAEESQTKSKAGKNVYDALLKAGYPDETAKLWQLQMENAPTGGQSDVIKNVNDLIRRSKQGKGIGAESETKAEAKPTIDVPGVDLGTLQLDFPELPEPIGMTPSDIVKQNEYREKTNIPLYTETVDRLNALDDEFREVKHLQDLNEIPGALPAGIERWNVNWDTGDLRIKGLATPEAQDYAKTIARMARRAKDFFPGRVTNFDLEQFKQGFPTLANSEEGRRLIAQQLALGNRIAYLKDETYKSAMDHYGSGADPVLIKKYATENYRRLKQQLEEQLKAVNEQARRKVEQDKKGQPKPLEEMTSIDEIFAL
jgi:hypothetical protein